MVPFNQDTSVTNCPSLVPLNCHRILFDINYDRVSQMYHLNKVKPVNIDKFTVAPILLNNKYNAST